MRAALLVAPGRIEVDDVAPPVVGPGDVEIAVTGVGLCGSDASVFSGKWATPASPWIMGHEAFGTIVQAGDEVPRRRISEMVAVEPNWPCFICRPCASGMTSACSSRRSLGMNIPGALAERVVVPSAFAWPIADMDVRDLVCVEPSTVVHAALRRAGDPRPASALIVGAGAQGMLMTLALAGRGVEVSVRDVNAARVAHAERLGARSAAAEERFPLVVDTVGSPASMADAVDHLEVAGTLLLLGLDDRPIDLTAQAIVRRQATIRGSLTYDHPIDFRSTIELIASGEFLPGRVVTDEYGLTDAQLAFERSPQAPGKTWIRVAEPRQES